MMVVKREPEAAELQKEDVLITQHDSMISNAHISSTRDQSSPALLQEVQEVDGAIVDLVFLARVGGRDGDKTAMPRQIFEAVEN
jgi:hypothetical protein